MGLVFQGLYELNTIGILKSKKTYIMFRISGVVLAINVSITLVLVPMYGISSLPLIVVLGFIIKYLLSNIGSVKRLNVDYSRLILILLSATLITYYGIS